MHSLDDIAARHGIELVLQFGSTVSGRVHERSDIDIGVLLSPSAAPMKFGELFHELQRLFPERELDLGILNHADPLFLKKVLENARLLYGSPRRLAELKMYAFRRFQEHRPYFAMERRYVDQALARLAAAPR